MLRTSNTKFFDVLDPIPLEGVGWEVIVKYHLDFSTTIAVASSFESLAFTRELNGAGVGSITLDLDMDVFDAPAPITGADILDRENLWEFYEDGILRFQFLGQKTSPVELDASERRTVTVTGPGAAWVLKWACVLPPSYPSVPPFYWTFTEKPFMSMFLSFLEASKSRGSIPYVNALFSHTEDTGGTDWTDSNSIQHENGTTLYDVLERNAQTIGADWFMQPGFKIDVRQQYGARLENTVVFYAEGAQTGRRYETDRSEISNVVVAQDAYGAISVAQDADSVAKWQRREVYVQAGNALTASTRGQVATASLNQTKDEMRSYTVNVLPWIEDASGAKVRRALVDYREGDWVGVNQESLDGETPSTITPFRIQALSGAVNRDGEYEVELILNSKRQIALARLRAAIERLGGQSGSITAAQPISVGVTAAAAINAANLEDLGNVQSGEPDTDNEMLFWDNAAGQWESRIGVLDDLSNVDTASATTGQVLTKGVDGVWRGATSSGGSGGTGALSGFALNQSFASTTTTVSTSAHATKGNTIIPVEDIVISEAYAALTTVAGLSYQFSMIRANASSVIQEIILGSTVSPPAGYRVIQSSFSPAVELLVGEEWMVCLTCTNNGNSYGLPLRYTPLHPTGDGAPVSGTPLGQLAQQSPVVGATFVRNGGNPGYFSIGYRWALAG